MPGSLPETLARIQQAIDEGVGQLEATLSEYAEELGELLATLDTQRRDVQRALEERDLDRTLWHNDNAPRSEGPVTSELRRFEDRITSDYSRVLLLYRQLTDFVHLLAATRQQFQSEGELPGLDDAQRLAVRQAMIRAQENERRRLAREIHDGPAQVLANAIIGLEFIERALSQSGQSVLSDAAVEINRVKMAMREGLTEIRRFIFDLRPTMLTQRGLTATIEHYVETYRQLFSGELELSIPDQLPKLSPDQELTAFRVIQESLQNVHRHARSTKTWVSLAIEGDTLVVRVRDNGQGFRPGAVMPTASGGFGLAGMRERAEVIGGRLTVQSAPGEGTAVTLVIPLTAHHRDAVHERTLKHDAPVGGAEREPGANPGH